MPHPLENIMQPTVSELKNLVDVNTIVGNPVQVGANTLIIPVSRITLGFVTGGGEYGVKNPILKSGASLDGDKNAYPFAGTMAAGLGVAPVSFLAVTDDKVCVLPAQENEPYARITALLPEILTEVREMLASCKKEGRTQ